MNPLQRRRIAKMAYKEIQDVIDKWSETEFVRVLWNGDIEVDGELFRRHSLQEYIDEDL